MVTWTQFNVLLVPFVTLLPSHVSLVITKVVVSASPVTVIRSRVLMGTLRPVCLAQTLRHVIERISRAWLVTFELPVIALHALQTRTSLLLGMIYV